MSNEMRWLIDNDPRAGEKIAAAVNQMRKQGPGAPLEIEINGKLVKYTEAREANVDLINNTVTITGKIRNLNG